MKWQKVRLDSVCESISDGDHLAPPKSDSGVPFITISNIDSNNNIDFTRCMYVPRSYYENVDSKRKPQRGDVLYSVVGSFGKPVLMRENAEFVFQRHIAILRPKSDVLSSRFLYATMLSPAFYALADAAAVGTAQRTVSLSSLRGMEISLPPLPIQQKIADILGAYDDLIENNRRRIELLEKMARELYRERFVRREGHLHEVSLMECSFISFCSSRIKKYNGSKRYLATADVDGQSIVGCGEVLQYDELPSRAQMLPELYSVWFARMSASYKILTFSDSNADLVDELILSSGFAGFKSVKKYWPYVRSFFSSEWFDSEKDRFATGATQISITNDGLKRIKIPIPQEKDAVEYARLVNPIFDEIDSLKKQSSNLACQRDRLLPRLMSGKIDLDKLVKEAE